MRDARYLRPQVNTKGLLAHWKLHDGFVQTVLHDRAFDYSLNGNIGTTTMITQGSYPGWKFIDGSQVNCGSGATLDNIFDGGGSFSGWLRPTGQGQANAGKVFDKSTNVSIGVVLECPTSDTTLQFTQVTDTTDGVWTFPLDITGDIWQHVILTYDADASANNPLVYVNGEAVAVTETGTPDDTRTSDAAGTMYLGQRDAGGHSWNGKLDDLMFFSRILSATEAKSIFSITRSRYGV